MGVNSVRLWTRDKILILNTGNPLLQFQLNLRWHHLIISSKDGTQSSVRPVRKYMIYRAKRMYA